MTLELATWSEIVVAQLVQVTLVAIAVAITVRLVARSRPHLAYLLWMLVIVKCLTPPIAASQTSVFSWAMAQSTPAAESEPNEKPLPVELAVPETFVPESPSFVDFPTAETEPAAPVVSRAEEPKRGRLTLASALLGAWSLGALALTLYIGAKWIRFRLRVSRSHMSTPAWLHERVAQLSAGIRLRRVPRIVLSSETIGPLSMGLWRPTIVLPAALIDESNGAALEPILAHELLHLRRGDVVFGHLQLVAQVVWWFHPLIWWANREARRERERCCDEAVLALLSCNPADYARTLIDILDLEHRHSDNGLLPIASASDLNDRRLRHIMRPAAVFHRHTPRWCYLTAAITAAACLPGAGLSLDAKTGDAASQPTDERLADTDPVDGTIKSADTASDSKQDDRDRQPRVPEFSARHNEAAKRLQELGARYSTRIDARTNRPYVYVRIPRGWKGAIDDWRLLAKLDMVAYVDAYFTAGDESGLDVLAELSELTILNLSPPTAEALAKIGPLKGLTTLRLFDAGDPKVELTADEFAPVGTLTKLTQLVINGVPLNDTALRHVGQLRGLKRLVLNDLKITDAGIAALATLDSLHELHVISASRNDEPAATRVSGLGLAKLARLPSLRWLSLSGPMVTDESLAGVAQLRGLEQLFLSDAGNITSAGIEALGKMTRLKRLRLSGPQLYGDDFAPLAELDNLRSLILYGKADLGDAGALHIADLVRLREIRVPGEGLTERGLLALVGLSELRTLSIPKAQLSGGVLDRLAELRELKILNFDAQLLDDDDVEKLRALPRLNHVSLVGFRITDEGLANLVRDDRYRYLDLERSQITDEGLMALASLKKLENLNLSGTAVTDAGLEKLMQIETLTSLDVMNTKVTHEGVKKLAEALPGRTRIWHDFQPGIELIKHTPLDVDASGEILGDDKPDEESVKESDVDKNRADKEQIDGAITPAKKPNVSTTVAPKFSARHNEAAKRLQELGVIYSASIDAQTKRPSVMVSIPRDWRGTADDWRLLAELEELATLNLVRPTAEALARIGPLKGLTTLFLYNQDSPKLELTADEFAPVGKLSQLKQLTVLGVPLNDAALRHIGKLRQLEMLSLEDLKITDAGIAALATLDNLRELYVNSTRGNDELTVTRVSGTGFAKLGQLPRLKMLNLRGSMVSDEGLVGVAQLQGLEQLHLSDAGGITAEGMRALGTMKQLKHLALSDLQLHGNDFAPLAQLENLRGLFLSGKADLGDAGARHIAGLAKLQEIYTPGKGLTERGLLTLAGLSELRSLRIHQAQLSAGVLDRLAKLRELKTLSFDARLLDDGDIEKLRAFPRLDGLSLDGARITDEGLANLVRDDRYEYLDLDRTQITDKGLAALAGLKKLERLHLSGTAITDAGLKNLQQLGALKSLDVINTKVTEEGVEKLAAALPGLKNFRHSFDPEKAFGLDIILPAAITNSKILADEKPDEEAAVDKNSDTEKFTGTFEPADKPSTFEVVPLVGGAGEGKPGDDRQPPVHKFSARHNEAAKRLRELGANYSAGIDTKTKRPSVTVRIGRGWKGTASDWRLLAELEGLALLSLSRPTADALAKIGPLKGLTQLLLSERADPAVELTADDFAPIGKLSHLKRLFVVDVPLKDAALTHIGQLRQLEILHLQDLKITDADIAALATLDNLRQLFVASSPKNDGAIDTRVSGIELAKLAQLSHLKSLTLGGPIVTDEALAGVAKLQGLEQLTLYDATNITAVGMEALGNLTRLELFMLGGPQLHGDDFAPLARMENLRTLVLHSKTDLGDAGALHIAGLTKLQLLNVPGKELTQRGLTAIAEMSNLQTLAIPQAQLSADMFDGLTDLNELNNLYFDARLLDDDGVEELRALPRLVTLSLAGARITDEGLAKLVHDDRYRYINLDRTRITDKGLEVLAGLKKLESLRLSGTAITDAGLENLHQIKTLKSLDLTKTKVTEEGVKKLAAALPDLESFRHSFVTENEWNVFDLESLKFQP